MADDTLVPYAPYSRGDTHPAGRPLSDCLTCPRLRDCALKAYVSGCIFRVIYMEQEAAEAERMVGVTRATKGVIRP